MECPRCGIGLPVGRVRQDHCRPCSAVLNRQIARWVESNPLENQSDFAAVIGITRDALSQRISRLKRCAK